jgi:hypothetical protein
MNTNSLELVDPDRVAAPTQGLLVRQAKEFISSFAWCRSVQKIYVGCIIERVVGLFLFEIVPSSSEIDKQLWVIVGDIPPAYLVTDQAENPSDALKLYIGEMRAWIEAVRTGKPTDDVIPVNANESEKSAAALESRLNFLEEKVVPSLGLPGKHQECN